MNDLMEIKKKIDELNYARIGAFGEYIFRHYFQNVLGMDVRSQHKDDVDFTVNGESVDVKTRGFKNKSLKFKGRKDIIYSFVKFADDVVKIYFKDKEYHLGWEEIFPLWEKWIRDDRKVSFAKDRAQNDSWKQIKKEIKDYFLSKGTLAIKIIQRTKRFKGESPGNLIDKIRSNNEDIAECCRIYVEFKGYPIAKDNIDMIFAFPERDIDLLPRLENVRLRGGMRKETEKIDLEKMPECYIFSNLDDLFKIYFARFN